MFENYKRFNFWLYTEIYEKITFDIDRKEGIRTVKFQVVFENNWTTICEIIIIEIS